MTEFPQLSTDQMLARLTPPTGTVRMVLDTDTYNEVDDQFALTYAVLAEQLTLEAIYAAPFHNNRSDGPKDGMLKSYDEILRVLDTLGAAERTETVYKGSESFLPAADTPVDSPAARDLVERAMASEDLLYVLPIGAPTNVSSALLMEPQLVERIVVVWLGGQPHDWPTAREFNLQQDMHASQLLFDSGVPFVHIPCKNVAEHLRTTIPELEHCLKGQSAVSDYLCEIVAGYTDNPWGWSKVIWDISTIAWLRNADWVPTNLVHAPILTDQITYSRDDSRRLMRVAVDCRRDEIFRDLFRMMNETPN